jgi:nickel-dependent lactate racemase
MRASDEKYYLNYEGRKIYFSLPPEWNVISNQDVAPAKGVSDVPAEVERALSNPIGSPPIEDLAKPGMNAVILFDDIQRPTPAYYAFPSILNKLNKGGIPDERISALCALGTHPIHTLEQMEGKIGEEASRRLQGRIISHDPHSRDNVVIGKTHRGTLVEVNGLIAFADLVIGVGECMPHPSNGFGGGCKIVMPGVSSYRAIADHHFNWMRHRNCMVNVLDGNPFYEEIIDAGRLARLAFKLDFVINEKREVVRAFGGDPVAEHKEASAFSAGQHLVPLATAPDLTITSAFPMEIGVQATKSLIMATYCTKAGGTIIWVAGQKQSGPILPLIKEMGTPESANDYHRKLANGHIPEQLKSFGISYIMQVVKFKEVAKKFNVIHVTEGLTPEQVKMMNFTYAASLDEAIALAHKTVPAADVAIFPSGGNIIPGRI